MYLATKMDGFLAVGDLGGARLEMPLEDWKADPIESMHSSVGIDDQLQRDVLRGATVRIVGQRADGGAVRRYRWLAAILVGSRERSHEICSTQHTTNSMRLLHGGIWIVTLSLLWNSAVLTAQQRRLAIDPAQKKAETYVSADVDNDGRLRITTSDARQILVPKQETQSTFRPATDRSTGIKSVFPVSKPSTPCASRS